MFVSRLKAVMLVLQQQAVKIEVPLLAVLSVLVVPPVMLSMEVLLVWPLEKLVKHQVVLE